VGASCGRRGSYTRGAYLFFDSKNWGKHGKGRISLTVSVERQFSHYPLKIADHVFIGPSSIIEAALIGSHVHIGANVVVGKFSIIKDYVRILDGSVVPPNMVIPSFSVVAGRPARVVGEIAEGEVDGMDLREVYRAVGNT
jgi:dynactin 5